MSARARWLPQESYAALVALQAALIGQHWLLVGALARDYAFRGSDDLRRLRATMDVDIAVLVDRWADYEALRSRLTSGHGFLATPMPHRLKHGSTGQLVDLLPFGGVESASEIAWPPEGSPVMNMLGYGDVYAAATTAEVDELCFKVATPAAVVALKVVSWHDRPSERGRDLIDIAAIVRGYVTEVLGWDRALSEHAEILDADDFDLDVAGAACLGNDIRGLLAPETHRRFVGLSGFGDADGPFVAGLQEALHCRYEVAWRIVQALSDA